MVFSWNQLSEYSVQKVWSTTCQPQAKTAKTRPDIETHIHFMRVGLFSISYLDITLLIFTPIIVYCNITVTQKCSRLWDTQRKSGSDEISTTPNSLWFKTQLDFFYSNTSITAVNKHFPVSEDIKKSSLVFTYCWLYSQDIYRCEWDEWNVLRRTPCSGNCLAFFGKNTWFAFSPMCAKYGGTLA